MKSSATCASFAPKTVPPQAETDELLNSLLMFASDPKRTLATSPLQTTITQLRGVLVRIDGAEELKIRPWAAPFSLPQREPGFLIHLKSKRSSNGLNLDI